MFTWAKRAFAYGKGIFERSLVEPDVNSRLIFLLTAIVMCALMVGHSVIYAIAFLRHSATDPAYPTILGVLAGGHGVNGLARFFTKKNGGDGGDAPPAPTDPSAAPAAAAPQSLPTPAGN